MSKKRQCQVLWPWVTGVLVMVLSGGPAPGRADEPAPEQPVSQIDPNASPEEMEAQIAAYLEARRKAVESMLASDPAWQPAFRPTHVIKVCQGSSPVEVHNFCLDRSGNVLACCGRAQRRFFQEQGRVVVQTITSSAEIRTYSPHGRHLTTWSLEFTPQAIAVHRDGTVFVGGDGRLVRLDGRGNVLAAADCPGLPDRLLAERARVEGPIADESETGEDAQTGQEEKGAAEDQQQPARTEQEPQAETHDTQETQPTNEGLARVIQAVVDLFTGGADEQPSWAGRHEFEVTGLAVTDQDLFVACPSKTGYAVWRMGLDFGDPVRIVDRLRGCCGQMDIAAHDGHLYVAENARKRVVCYDRHGNLLGKFGHGDRQQASGFGSCCNPMNLCFSPAGEVITSESGPPDAVKRFSRDGQFLGVVALPRLEGGCVRVPVAMSRDGHQLFVAHGIRGEIHVFADPRYSPTHRQVATIAIPMGEQTAAIHSFCVDSRGNLLAACGGERMVYTRGPNGAQIQTVHEPSGIQVISPDGQLLETWSLEITPQVVNVGPDGSVYCGGQGRLAKLSPEGKVLLVADSPQMAELAPLEPLKPDAQEETAEEDEAAKKAREEERKAKIEALTRQMSVIRREMDELSRKIRAKQEADEDDPPKAGLEAELEKALLEYYRISGQLQELTLDPEVLAVRRRAAALRKQTVTGIAVTEADVFVACPAAVGAGYDVWRLDLQLAQPQKIVSRLRGCCGQMDIQAFDGKLYVAENARKRVLCYDREGNQLAAWGSADRQSVEGFASCCNPMNIRLGPDGVVYTSEASVGRIKRFSRKGEFLGLVGTVSLVPGCKHVPIAISPDGSRVYMLDITRTHIVAMERRDAGGEP